MNRASRAVAAAVALVALAGGAWLFWRDNPPPAAPVAIPALPPIAPSSPAAPPPPAHPAPLPILHPIAAPKDGTPLPPLAESDPYATGALSRLLGRKAVRAFLSLDGFVRNFVVTVDNLASDRAQSMAWPVRNPPGRFTPAAAGASMVISAENAARYAPLVHLVESVDTDRAVALYVRTYPLFQRAWQELGTPGKYFNDRVVEVIDNLLATPDVPRPIKVRRVEVQGALRSGALYVFDDPTLEARSAGQKILLRIGKTNADALKAKLTDVRARIVKGAAPGRP